MGIDYQFTLHNPQGVPLRTLKVGASDLAIAEKEVGTVVLDLDPTKYNYFDFHRNQILTVERSIDGRRPYLVGERLWFLRQRYFEEGDEKDLLQLTFKDTNTVLDNPIAAYFDTEPEVDVFGPADDLLKDIVDVNLGAGALDADRDVSAWLGIAPKIAACPDVEKQFPWQRILQTMSEISQTSENYGMYLGFDVICVMAPHVVQLSTAPRFKLEFRTFPNQRGKDRRISAGAKNVLIGSDFKNLKNLKMKDDWTNEFTHVYAGGEGSGLLREVEEADYPALGYADPFARREGWYDVRDLDLIPDIQDEANAFLQQHLTRTSVSGTFVDTEKVRWDIDVGFGDLVSVQNRGRRVDVRLSKVHMTWRPGPEGEQLDILMEGIAGDVST